MQIAAACGQGRSGSVLNFQHVRCTAVAAAASFQQRSVRFAAGPGIAAPRRPSATGLAVSGRPWGRNGRPRVQRSLAQHGNAEGAAEQARGDQAQLHMRQPDRAAENLTIIPPGAVSTPVDLLLNSSLPQEDQLLGAHLSSARYLLAQLRRAAVRRRPTLLVAVAQGAGVVIGTSSAVWHLLYCTSASATNSATQALQPLECTTNDSYCSSSGGLGVLLCAQAQASWTMSDGGWLGRWARWQARRAPPLGRSCDRTCAWQRPLRRWVPAGCA